MFQVEDVLGKDVITGDAMEFGTVESIGLDTRHWAAPVLRVSLRKGMEQRFGVKKPVFSAARIYIDTGSVESVSDMITLNVQMGDIKEHMVDITETEIAHVGDFVGKKVIAKGGKEIGILENFLIDRDDWNVPMMEVRINKTAAKEMGLKRGMRVPKVIRLDTADIRIVGDMILMDIDQKEVADHVVGTRKKKKAPSGATESATSPGEGVSLDEPEDRFRL